MGVSILGGRHAELSPELARQMALVAKTGGQRNITDREVAITQHGSCPVNPLRPHVFPDGAAVARTEHPCQMPSAHTCYASEFLESGRLAQAVVEILPHLDEPRGRSLPDSP